jgi:hypothetical protein
VAVPLTTRVDQGGVPLACDRRELGAGAFTERCDRSERHFVVTSGIGQ